jgi:seryl-tRNA synthetase
MLDVAFIRENLAAVKANCVNRNVTTADVDKIIALDDRRKQLVHETQIVQQRQNELSKSIPKEKDPAKKQELVAEGRSLREQVTKGDEAVKLAEAELRAAVSTLPNMTHPAAPIGKLESDSKVLKTIGEKAKFDFKPKDHVDLCDALQLADFEAGASVAGQKFYFLKNEAVLLELALVNYAFGILLKHGFTPVITPDVARVEVLEGTGFMPRGEGTQIYTLAGTDLCLVATAEITLGGMHRDQILDESQLPILYAGLSHCFRTEAGAAGRDQRGLYRVHQFTKVEMFAFSTPEQSEEIHQKLLVIEEEIFTGLGLTFHVLDIASGDLGGPAYRKYDLEAWMPGRGEAGEFGEVTSTSNCTDFQARRLNIRYKGPKHKGTRFVHTLNGTAVAVTRALVAILETYQQADGSVVVPPALRTWVGKDRIGPRK